MKKLAGHLYKNPLLDLEFQWEMRHRKEILKAWESAIPKLSLDREAMGKIIVFGTGGDVRHGKFERMNIDGNTISFIPFFKSEDDGQSRIH